MRDAWVRIKLAWRVLRGKGVMYRISFGLIQDQVFKIEPRDNPGDGTWAYEVIAPAGALEEMRD